MRVQEIMTQPPQTCRLDTNLAVASRQMKEMGCGTLAVLDRDGRLAGILTDRDLAMAVGDTRREASRIAVDKAMTHHVHTCRTTEDVRVALAKMAAAKVRRLPVLDDQGHLRGIVSLDDIVLWGVDHGAVATSEVAGALRSICASRVPALELEGPRF